MINLSGSFCLNQDILQDLAVFSQIRVLYNIAVIRMLKNSLIFKEF